MVITYLFVTLLPLLLVMTVTEICFLIFKWDEGNYFHSTVFERMDNERLLKKVMNAKVDGRSARGRPRFGWMDGVKRALNDRRMDMREASEHARNRNEWRMIVIQF